MTLLDRIAYIIATTPCRDHPTPEAAAVRILQLIGRSVHTETALAVSAMPSQANPHPERNTPAAGGCDYLQCKNFGCLKGLRYPCSEVVGCRINREGYAEPVERMTPERGEPWAKPVAYKEYREPFPRELQRMLGAGREPPQRELEPGQIGEWP